MFEFLSGVVKDYVDHKRLRDLFENGMDEQYREKVKYQISRLFTFKAICDVFDGDITKIKYKQVKSTKRMPDWWNPDLDSLLTAGCFKHGWGNYIQEMAEVDGFRKLVKEIPAPKAKKRKNLRSGKKKKAPVKPEEPKKEPTFEEKLAQIKWVNGPLQIDRLKSLSTTFRKQIKEERQKAENARIKKKREEEKRARQEKQRALNEKKRVKAENSRNSKKRRFNQAFTNPELTMPFVISPTKVILNLGVVEYENEHFSHKTYIWPLGFKSKVQGDSTVKKGEKAWYFTEIKKGPQGQLEFHVTADDRVDGWRMVGTSASQVWKKVLEEQKAKGMLSTQKSVTVSGTDKMGINHNLVKTAIEFLPNAEKCKRYTFKYNQAHIKKKQPKMTEYWPILKQQQKPKKLAPKEAIPMEGKFVEKLSFAELENAHTTNSITERNEPRATTRKKMSDEDISNWIKKQNLNGNYALTPNLLRTSLGIGYNRARQYLQKNHGYIAAVAKQHASSLTEPTAIKHHTLPPSTTSQFNIPKYNKKESLPPNTTSQFKVPNMHMAKAHVPHAPQNPTQFSVPVPVLSSNYRAMPPQAHQNGYIPKVNGYHGNNHENRLPNEMKRHADMSHLPSAKKQFLPSNIPGSLGHPNQ